jgi:hypothetical protein
MEQPWTKAESESSLGLEIDAPPMSQEEALSIIKAVAAKYAADQRLATQLDDWVAGCTDDFDD